MIVRPLCHTQGPCFILIKSCTRVAPSRKHLYTSLLRAICLHTFLYSDWNLHKYQRLWLVSTCQKGLSEDTLCMADSCSVWCMQHGLFHADRCIRTEGPVMVICTYISMHYIYISIYRERF